MAQPLGHAPWLHLSELCRSTCDPREGPCITSCSHTEPASCHCNGGEKKAWEPPNLVLYKPTSPQRLVPIIIGGRGPEGPEPERGFQYRSRALALSACSSTPFISTRRVESGTVDLCF